MKGFIRFIMIFSLIIFIIGLILCIVGVLMGGKMQLGFWNCETKEINKEFENSDDIEKIEMDFNYGVINIKKGDKFKIEGNVPEKVEFKAEVKDGILRISDKKVFWDFFMDFNPGENGRVTLYVPEKVELKKCEMDFGACDANIEGLKADNLRLSVGAGKCVASNIEVKEGKIEIGAGNLEIEADVKEKLKLECGVGNAEVKLIGEEDDFDYSVECGVGNVDIDGETYRGIGNDGKKDNDADKKLDIECGVGNINVDFKEE